MGGWAPAFAQHLLRARCVPGVHRRHLISFSHRPARRPSTASVRRPGSGLGDVEGPAPHQELTFVLRPVCTPLLLSATAQGDWCSCTQQLVARVPEERAEVPRV